MSNLNYQLTEEIIGEVKKLYPDIALHKITIPAAKAEFLIRPMYPADSEVVDKLFQQQTKTSAYSSLEDYAFSKCVLWPNLSEAELEKLPIGVKPEVLNAVLRVSGYQSVTITGELIGDTKRLVPISLPETWGPPGPEDVELLQKNGLTCSLFNLRVGNYYFIIRPILTEDVKRGLDITDPMLVMDACSVWPENFSIDHIPYGTVFVIYSQIKNISGETNDIEIVEL